MTTTPPGWYAGAGDPDGTERWWDGNQWVGEPRPLGGSPLPPPPASVVIPPMPPATSSLGTSHGTSLGESGAASSLTSPTHGFAPGDPWRRFGAAVLDVLVSLVLALPLIVDMVGQIDFDAVADGKQPVFQINAGPALLSGILGLIYAIVPIAVKGTTLGKAAVGLRVVRAADGVSPPGWAAAFRRYVPVLLANVALNSGLGPVALLIFIASIVMMNTDKVTRRSLADRFGRTLVVRVR